MNVTAMNDKQTVLEGQGKRFRPADHLIQLKGKDYLPVQWRLVWFRQECPQGEIVTELVHLDLEKEVTEEVVAWNPQTRKSEKTLKLAKGIAIFRARVTDGRGGVATGTKSENAAAFADFIEKSETGAIGRALAGLGYGTQFAPELSEEHRIVDAPVERGEGQKGSAPTGSEPKASEQQRSSIRNLCQNLKQGEPVDLASMSAAEASKLIKELAAEYNEQKQRQTANT